MTYIQGLIMVFLSINISSSTMAKRRERGYVRDAASSTRRVEMRRLSSLAYLGCYDPSEGLYYCSVGYRPSSGRYRYIYCVCMYYKMNES